VLALFRDQGRHEERLFEYEKVRAWIEKEWGKDIIRTDSPRFASQVVLRRGTSTSASTPSGVAGSPNDSRRTSGIDVPRTDKPV